MRVLVTGASGFLGAWLCRRLQEMGVDLVVLARPTSDLSELEGLKYQLAAGDVTNLESLKKAAAGVDGVYHLAGLVGYSRAQRAAMEKVNVEGTENVLKACEANRVRRLLHVSSVCAIGAGFNPQEILNEKSPYTIGHLNLGYFETKRKSEILVQEFIKKGAVDAVIVNPSTIYGGGDAKKGSRKTQLKVARGEFPFYTNGGASIVNVHDVVPAMITAFEKGRTGERYILSGENITIKRLFGLIAAEGGVEPPKVFLPNLVVHTIGKFGDVMESMGKKGPINTENAWTSTLYHWFDSSKAKQELGLKQTPASESIKESVGWMREHGLLKK